MPTASLQLQLNEAQDTTAFCVNDELLNLMDTAPFCYSFHNDLNHLMQTMSFHLAESFPASVNNGHVLTIYWLFIVTVLFPAFFRKVVIVSSFFLIQLVFIT